MKFKLIMLFWILPILAFAQSGSFIVGGDSDKYYPVIFQDSNWDNSLATVVQIGRSNVHTDGSWKGSLIAKISFHTTNWGHGARYSKTEIWQKYNQMATSVSFIAGYYDATTNNATSDYLIWLKGGGTTYYYSANAPQSPRIYDGVQNALPYQEVNGATHTFKTAVDSYVNSWGETSMGSISLLGTEQNFMNGGLGLGTSDLKGYKLAVNGNIRAKEIKVEATNWPDYVFQKAYKLPSLAFIKTYIDQNQHLPEMPSEQEITKNGVSLGEVVKIQTKKIEELTLYLIEKDEQVNKLQDEVKQLKKSQEDRIAALEKTLSILTKFK